MAKEKSKIVHPLSKKWQTALESRTNRLYPQDAKDVAVEFAKANLAENVSFSVICEELDVNTKTLQTWIDEAAHGSKGKTIEETPKEDAPKRRGRPPRSSTPSDTLGFSTPVRAYPEIRFDKDGTPSLNVHDINAVCDNPKETRVVFDDGICITGLSLPEIRDLVGL